MPFYENIRNKFTSFVKIHELNHEEVAVLAARPLSANETIGDATRKDFPLLKGKEFMMEAVFHGAKGHAYTDMPGNFNGSIEDVLSLNLSDNFQRALFIASLNAVMRHLGIISHTVHCRDKEPESCALELVDFILRFYGRPSIGLVGYQPSMAAQLSKYFFLRVADLDPDNISHEKSGIVIENPGHMEQMLACSDLILATGSTVVNSTVESLFQAKKPVIFYGVTIAGIAELNGYARFCPCSH
jgi:uncharacterized protein (DUF4213/DUF364 family)